MMLRDPGAATLAKVEMAEPARWRAWFAPTGAPPAWALVRYLTAELIAGAALSGALPHVRATLLGALTAGIVAAAGSTGPSGISRRVAVIAAVAGLVLILLAGAPAGEVAGWAGRRLLDTILGCALALVATYVLWPRAKEAEQPVPVPAA